MRRPASVLKGGARSAEQRVRDEHFIGRALIEAERVLKHGDVPIGALVVRDGEVIAAAGNERELRQDPTGHAEIVALRQAAAGVGSWRLLDCVLYVTLEPCAMCAGAAVLARVPRIVFGAYDLKAGACGSVLNVPSDPRLNHRPEVSGGLLEHECARLLGDFFAGRRHPGARGSAAGLLPDDDLA